jgi:sensor histidine kinase YesM
MGKVIRHVLVWLVYIVLNYAINRIFIEEIRFLDNLLVCLIVVLFFYWFVGLFLLIYRKKFRLYGISLLLLSFFVLYHIAYAYVYGVLPLLGVSIFEEGLSFHQKEFLQNYCLLIFRALIYAFLYFLLLRYMDLSRKREQDLKEKLASTERINHYRSRFLTSQIFPHFVRNTFQSLAGGAMIRGDEETANTVFTLSSLMDYTTEQANAGNGLVYVQQELTYLKMLTDLIRRQHESEAVVELVKEGNFKGEKIPPLTLLTFIENVFKYGKISTEHPLFIHVSFEEPGFSFLCRNRKKANLENIPSSNIGLENVKQRLEIHLPDLHEFRVEESLYYFKVMLAIRSTI